MTKKLSCPLCQKTPAQAFYSKVNKREEARDYYECLECQLIFVDPDQYVSHNEEKRQYDLHNNSPDQKGYVEFLNQLIEPLAQRLPEGATGLDFGSGPGPTLNQLMEKLGFQMSTYDPIYQPDATVLSQTYDFVTCTEVVEHLKKPANTFETLKSLVPSGGLIGMMTQLVYPDIDFPSWWYPRDPTHICFYKPQTFDWIANYFGFALESPSKNVILLSRI